MKKFYAVALIASLALATGAQAGNKKTSELWATRASLFTLVAGGTSFLQYQTGFLTKVAEKLSNAGDKMNSNPFLSGTVMAGAAGWLLWKNYGQKKVSLPDTKS